MKTVMYMATSVNGMISTLTDDTPWSKEEFNAFYKFATEAGNMIIGRKTYEIMSQDGELKKLKDITVIIMTHKRVERHLTAKTPAEALEIVKKLKMSTALVCGGTKTNTAFLSAKLIDEIILDVEPIIISQGKNLVDELSKEIKLKLISKKDLSKDSLQLRYKVVK